MFILGGGYAADLGCVMLGINTVNQKGANLC